MEKKRVGILFGGQSAEHEISLLSAKNVINAIDRSQYDVYLMGIDKNGQWYLYDQGASPILNIDDPKKICLNPANRSPLCFLPHKTSITDLGNHKVLSASTVNVIFPVLHGTNGEDGTIQGILQTAGIPYVGADVLGSAVGMDKDVMKRLLRDSEIPSAKFITVHEHEISNLIPEKIFQELGNTLFVKPANSGSSVGVHKVRNAAELQIALHDAFQFDHKVLIEEAIIGRELEIGVLGNEKPQASVAGEIIPKNKSEFYSYEAKYLDEKGADLEAPAKLTADELKNMQQLAINVYKIVGCKGMARVDFFLRPNGEFVVNEINTLPGFTQISMYPRLWELSGVPYSALVDQLLQLAIAHHKKQSQLKHSYH